MHQKLKRTNRKRLASLSALGAGALGVVVCPANANDIVFSGVINVEIPYQVGQYTILGPNGVGGVLEVTSGCQITCFQVSSEVEILSKPGKYGTQFRLLATTKAFYAQGEPLGAVWSTLAGKSTRSADIAAHINGEEIITTFNSTDRYLLFRFQGGALARDIFGWARLKVTSRGIFAPEQVDLVDWAYDTSGVRLPAGYHGGNGQHDPEDIGTLDPSTFDATGLPALALGAPGVRRWRAARDAEVTAAAASKPAP
jgi:hypothetical protein